MQDRDTVAEVAAARRMVEVVAERPTPWAAARLISGVAAQRPTSAAAVRPISAAAARPTSAAVAQRTLAAAHHTSVVGRRYRTLRHVRISAVGMPLGSAAAQRTDRP